MESSQEILVQKLNRILKEVPEGYPIRPVIQFSLEENSFSLMFQIRTNSYNYSNDRTDLHEGLSVLFAIYMRLLVGFSSSLFDMEHPFTGIESELYARFLFIAQPQIHQHPLDELAFDTVSAAIFALTQFPCWLSQSLEWIKKGNEYHPKDNLWDKREYPESASWEYAMDWVQPIKQVLNLPELNGKVSFMSRTNPTWMHFRSMRPRISVLKVPGIAASIREAFESKELWKVIRTNDRLLFVSEEAKNSVALPDIRLAKKILKVCEGGSLKFEPSVIPLDNHFVLVGDTHLIIKRKDCGRKRFEIDRERVRQNYAETVSVLFPTPQFEWNDRVDDDEFEQLILALLARDSQVSWVRKVGSTRDRDAGRDLIAEWATSPFPNEVLKKGESPITIRRVVVQCKAYGRPVDKSKVIDIRDVVDHHEASGYFLAVSSGLTSGLFDHLDRLRLGGKIWVDWWTRPEIEERLKEHPDIVSKFPKVIRPIN